tara:strand:- start:246 stop:446 length:201 start_codon:yes stop_codon:yes gene_type:complete
MKNKKRKDMTDQEFAKYWSGQLDFVQQSLTDEEIPENVKEILGEWLMDRAKEILPKDKEQDNGKTI